MAASRIAASAAEELNPGAAMSQISHSTEADGAIHIVTLNRPDAQNALTMDRVGWMIGSFFGP